MGYSHGEPEKSKPRTARTSCPFKKSPGVSILILASLDAEHSLSTLSSVSLRLSDSNSRPRDRVMDAAEARSDSKKIHLQRQGEFHYVGIHMSPWSVWVEVEEIFSFPTAAVASDKTVWFRLGEVMVVCVRKRGT